MSDLMLLLHVVRHALETELAVRLAELGITPRERCVLAKAAGCELTQTELAEQCNLDKTTMVVTMDTLERSGLAERKPSATDRRARIVGLTEAGLEMSRRADKVVADVYDDVLKSLPAQEREGFVGALNRLAEGRLSVPAPCEKPPRRRAVKAPKVIS